mgnify:CR=1 FL=1
MAVLTGITGAVRANIAGAAQQAVRSAATGVKKIAGLPTEGGNSALGAASNLMGGTSSNILTYPIAVDTDPQQGHYILFHINTRKNGKLLTPKSGKNMKAVTDKIRAEINQEPEDIGAAGNPDLSFDGAALPKTTGASGPLNRSILLSKLPTKRLEKSIALYMPPSVQVTYDAKYAEQEIGAIAMMGSDVIDAVVSGGGDTSTMVRGVLDALTGDNLKEGVNTAINKSLDTVAPGAEALLNLAKGSVTTPRMELMFEGVGRRDFTYTFAFIPKSKQEALIVEDIIKHFKFYMMPAYSNPTTKREMDIPGTFDIQYMYRGSENSFINKISTCFLKNVQVQYGADRYTAYEEIPGRGSPPQKSSITLNFSEIEVLSQDHIAEGF